MGLLTAPVLLASACAAQQHPVEFALQIPNPPYVMIDESIFVDAPIDQVWARVGGRLRIASNCNCDLGPPVSDSPCDATKHYLDPGRQV
jgi:hypothetical protein